MGCWNKEGDIELIRIYLSETISDDSEDLIFKIDKTNQTASLFEIGRNLKQVLIPRTVKHGSTEYLITSVTGVIIISPHSNL